MRGMVRFPRTHRVCIVNEKGGCGKTTCLVNIAHEFANRGSRVLVVDMDKQRDATDTLLPDALRGSANVRTVADVLIGGSDAGAAAMQVDKEESAARFNGNLFLIPAHEHQHATELEIQLGLGEQAALRAMDQAGHVDRQRKAEIQAALELDLYDQFRKRMDAINGRYDVVLFDTPGNPGLLTNLALAASEWALAVTQPSGYDVKGIGQLKKTLTLVRQAVNPGLRLVGCILNGVQARTRVARRWNEQISRAFGNAAQFQSTVPRSVRFEECADENITVFENDRPGTERLRESFRHIVSEMIAKGEGQLQAGMATTIEEKGVAEPAAAVNE